MFQALALIFVKTFATMLSGLQSRAKYVGNLLGTTENIDLKSSFLTLLFGFFQQDNYIIELLIRRLGGY